MGEQSLHNGAVLPVDRRGAVRNGWEIVIAIVNDGGRIIALHRMDGARPGNDEIALGKANTSAMTCRPSGVWERWIDSVRAALLLSPFSPRRERCRSSSTGIWWARWGCPASAQQMTSTLRCMPFRPYSPRRPRPAPGKKTADFDLSG